MIPGIERICLIIVENKCCAYANGKEGKVIDINRREIEKQAGYSGKLGKTSAMHRENVNKRIALYISNKIQGNSHTRCLVGF